MIMSNNNNNEGENQMVVSNDKQNQLKEVFDYFADENDWKAPIYQFISKNRMDKRGWNIALVKESIKFYTATIPTFDFIPCTNYGFFVKADGYRMGPAGDQ